MGKLTFTTTSGWNLHDGFGCASLGLAGLCDNSESRSVQYPVEFEGIYLIGSYEKILERVQNITAKVYAAIVLFGNAGGENLFIQAIRDKIPCPMVGGGAAIDPVTGRSALLSGGGEAAVFLITDGRYSYQAETKCIHDRILEDCTLELLDSRTVQKINGVDALQYLCQIKEKLGYSPNDFEHVTLSDRNHVNAHLSVVDGVVKSGRDLQEKMILRYVAHEDVYPIMRDFYDDNEAIIFGCAGLSGLLDRPLDTNSLGLFLFGEVCTTGDIAEFGNLMLSKLKIIKR